MTPTIVSIVTPSFNQGRFVEETIKSVISQEGDFHIEYLIMDGGSTDDSVEVIKKYGRLLKEGKWPVRCRGIEYKWVSEKDKGQADAVNKGFSASKGEMLGWLNSDDTYLPGAIEKAVRFFNEHKDVMMLYGEGYHIKESGEVIQRYYTEPFDKKRLAEVCFICQPAVFLRRRV
ncbi:MAG: glycosyltransferase family 2 protein, partial [Deltaproteobacteria bacterium]|nr:glycosyltransferase family 2 protein [Deltaproteobacteria bacterium]